MNLTSNLQHPFDSAGRMYDQEGKLRQWWTNATSEGFKVKEKCIVNQYAGMHSFCLTQMFSENLPDGDIARLLHPR